MKHLCSESLALLRNTLGKRRYFFNSFRLILKKKQKDQNCRTFLFFWPKVLKVIFCFLYITVMVKQPLYRKINLIIQWLDLAILWSHFWFLHNSSAQELFSLVLIDDCVLIGNRKFNKVWVCALERHISVHFISLLYLQYVIEVLKLLNVFIKCKYYIILNIRIYCRCCRLWRLRI